MTEVLVGVLDERAAAAVEALQRRLGGSGVPPYPPHVSFAVAETVGEGAVRAAQEGGEGRLRLTLDTLGVFGGDQGVLFLGVTPTEALVATHAAVHRALRGDGGGPYGHFHPGVWVPHCTLASGLDGAALGRAVTALHPLVPVGAHIARWEVVALPAA